MKKQIYFKKFNELSEKDFLRDHHMHTDWTHAEDSVEDMIKTAEEKGLLSIAFTEHVNSVINWYPDFAKEVRDFGKLSKLDVFLSVEAKAIDYLGNIDISNYIFSLADFVVGSVHRYPLGNKKFLPLEEIPSLGQEKAAKMEFDAARSILNSEQADVLGHPFGVYSRYFNKFPEKEMYLLIQESLKKRKAIEINTSYNHGKEFVSLLRKVNPFVSIGSDAHRKEDIQKQFSQIKKKILS